MLIYENNLQKKFEIICIDILCNNKVRKKKKFDL